METRMDLKVLQYIENRIKTIDMLIEQQPVGSDHRYALTAGKYELLLLCHELKNGKE